MSNFVTDTYARLLAEYEAMDDFGPGPLFGAISHLIANQQVESAYAIAQQASAINMDNDPFIVEGETSNNQVFMEVFRRVFFAEDYDSLPQVDRNAYRVSVQGIGMFIMEYRRRIEHSVNLGRKMHGAANDERA